MVVIVEQSMSWFWGFVLATFLSALLILYFSLSRFFPHRFRLSGSHVVVTGGSSGIGLSCAVDCASRGASVTLLARDESKLARAKETVVAATRDRDVQRVTTLSLDLSRDPKEVEAAFERLVEDAGPVDCLINCAGSGVAAAFDDTDPSSFEWFMRHNYLSAVYATKAALPSMKTRGVGRILFTSSQAGQLGLFGYTAYSASKFALRGFAESLQMEVKPFRIFLTLAFPPDTDTPGFAEELKSFPPETKEISATSGLHSAAGVARRMVDDLVDGTFLCSIGLDGFLLNVVTTGMSPVTSILELLVQCCLMSPFRFVAAFYLASFDGICFKWRTKKNEKKSQ